MLFLNIIPIIRLRGIEKPFSFLVKNGFTNHSAHYLLSGSQRSIRLDHIEKFCLLFKCTPNDILCWKQDSSSYTDEKTPLYNLKIKESSSFDMKATLMNLPLDELKSMAEKFTKDVRDNNMNYLDK